MLPKMRRSLCIVLFCIFTSLQAQEVAGERGYHFGSAEKTKAIKGGVTRSYEEDEATFENAGLVRGENAKKGMGSSKGKGMSMGMSMGNSMGMDDRGDETPAPTPPPTPAPNAAPSTLPPVPSGCIACETDDDCTNGGDCVLRSGIRLCTRPSGLMSNQCYCDTNEQCRSGRCDERTFPYRCRATLDVCRNCVEPSDCDSGICFEVDDSTSVCALESGILDTGCDCAEDSQCETGVCGDDSVCSDLLPLGRDCTASSECSSNFCYAGVCTRDDRDKECVLDEDCSTGRCDTVCLEKLSSCEPCDEVSDCFSGSCSLHQGLRTCSREDGKVDDECYCDEDKDCASGRCEEKQEESLCKPKLGRAENCDEDSDCISGECSAFLWIPGTCQGNH